jgi:hypothetical protein
MVSAAVPECVCTPRWSDVNLAPTSTPQALEQC